MSEAKAKGARNTKDAAEYLDVSIRTLYLLMEAGKLRGFTIGSKRLFATDELDRFVREASAAGHVALGGDDAEAAVTETLRALRGEHS